MTRVSFGTYGPPVPRCECKGHHIVIREPYRPSVDICSFCGGWFSIRITTAEELADFMEWARDDHSRKPE